MPWRAKTPGDDDLAARLGAATTEVAALKNRLRQLRDCADHRCALCAVCLAAAQFERFVWPGGNRRCDALRRTS
jgi:hypothetical protein